MIKIITAIDEDYSITSIRAKKVFLAGGITNCPDWQEDLLKLCADKVYTTDVVFYNPRRKDFPIGDPNAAEQQITWEFKHLREADLIVYWFSKGSLNPIVLYELGMWGNSRLDKPIIVGIDPEYERSQDVIIQTELARRDVKIVTSLMSVSILINKYINNYRVDHEYF